MSLINIFECRSKLAENEMNQYSLIPALLAVLVLYAFELYKERKISIIPPFETLVSTSSNQKLTIFAFGTMANSIIRLIVTASQSTQNGTWLEVTKGLGLFLLNFLIIATINYPTFLCICSPYKFVAAILGIMVILQKMAFFFLSITNLNCQANVNQGSAIGVKILQYIPTIICFLLVLYKFIRQFLTYLKQRKFGRIDTQNSLANEVHLNHLKELLRKDKLPILPPAKIQWYKKPYRKCLNVYNSSVQYSNLFLCSVAVILIAYYYFLVAFIYIGASNIDKITPFLENYNVTTNAILVELVDGLLNSYFIAMVLTFIFYTWLLLDLLQSHQNNLRQIFAGKHQISIEERLSPQDLTLYNIIFPGYFISYMIWGVIVFFAVTFILVFLVYGFILILVFLPGWIDMIVAILKYLYLVLTLPLLAYLIQYVLVLFYFTDRKSKKLTMLRNNNSYHFVMYVFFFYNLIVGVVSCIKRSITGLLISLLVLGRIDQTPFAFLKHYDTGYCAYHGFLRLQGVYKNPVMRCFLQMLNESIDKDNLLKTIEDGFPRMHHSGVDGFNTNMFPQHTQPITSKKVRNRWFLAYTLLRNPTLVNERRRSGRKEAGDLLVSFEGEGIEHNNERTNNNAESDNYDGGQIEYSGKDLFLI
eukprot:TCONS_00059165-protein